MAIHDLTVEYATRYGGLQAVRQCSLELGEREMLGLMGESGSGKSTLALSILRLILPPGQVVSGEILFRDKDLLTVDDATIRRIRGKEISMVFQNPLSALNPVMTIGQQLTEVIKLHRGVSQSDAEKTVADTLAAVGFPDPQQALRKYPHELSGGMNQRALVAMAVSCKPFLMLCDEPTSALDVSTQAQILGLLIDMRDRYGMSLLIITHNPGVIAETCERVAVMYAGRIVEIGTVVEIFSEPRHPYTRGLIKSMVHIEKKVQYFETVPGEVTKPLDPSLCPFLSRCPVAVEKCKQLEPPLVATFPGHQALCHRAEEEI